MQNFSNFCKYFMRHAIVMIIHYTFGWSKDCLNSLKDFCPEKKVIVFNNNPTKFQTVQETRCQLGFDPLMNKLCQDETNFVRNHRSVSELVEVPRQINQKVKRLPYHGDVLDFITNWLNERNYDAFTHIEPDCFISGNKWLGEMIKQINQGIWVVGFGKYHKTGDYIMPMCPTTWSIKPISNLINQGLSFNKTPPSQNTGWKIMQACRDAHKLTSIDSDDFIHYAKGSGRRHCSSIPLL